MAFPKGDHERAVELGKLGGRPKGSTDRKWADLRWWFALVENSVGQLKPEKQAEIGIEGMRLLISKMPMLPASPEESRNRVALDSELDNAERKLVPTPATE